MADKLPQPTGVLISRLQRVARWFDKLAATEPDRASVAQFRARANTCWQAAARLEELLTQGRAASGVPEDGQ